MGPKKKGKQNKLTKLSDEDRLRYLQHKAAQEEEARRRKQQLVANFVKVEFILAIIICILNLYVLHESFYILI
jgi:hypothetical protein